MRGLPDHGACGRKPTFKSHWITASPDGRQLVLTSYGPRVLLFDFDPDSGRIAIDADFRDVGAAEPGLDLQRADWPHGAGGPARCGLPVRP